MKLRQLQAEGVKATKEVQSSARRVLADNNRLKALLRFKGVDDKTIATWTSAEIDDGYELEGRDQVIPVTTIASRR